MTETAEEDSEDSSLVDTDQMDLLAEDAIELFRVNLLMVGIYVSVIAILTRTGSGNELSGIIQSLYTKIGALFWLGSSGLAIISYRGSRLLSTAHLRDDPREVTDTYRQIAMARNISSVALGTLIAVIALIVGVFDGLAQTSVDPSVPFLLTIIAIASVVGVQIGLKVVSRGLDNIDRLTTILANKLLVITNRVLLVMARIVNHLIVISRSLLKSCLQATTKILRKAGRLLQSILRWRR